MILVADCLLPVSEEWVIDSKITSIHGCMHVSILRCATFQQILIRFGKHKETGIRKEDRWLQLPFKTCLFILQPNVLFSPVYHI